MNFTKVECISTTCAGKHIIMNGRGGNFGGRVTTAHFECPECGTKMSIFLWPDDCSLEYRATTEEERKTEFQKKRKESESAEKLKTGFETILRIYEAGMYHAGKDTILSIVKEALNR
jgi:predicted RNA-binding Zn-ribbon protein involved in translation (DUF1610 family)